MTKIHHLIGGYLHAPPNRRVICHCLLLEDPTGLALVDTGIGLLDVRSPVERVGREAIEAAGFQFDEANTLRRQLTRLGFDPADVAHVMLTHADPDHAGGLADFAGATVHVSAEERGALEEGNPRYRPPQFAHAPRWRAYGPQPYRWFGAEGRPVTLGFSSEVWLIPLFGHTRGHCGVAIRQDAGWVLHVGDAYYLHVELATDDHPVSALTARNAVDDEARRTSLDRLRRLVKEHGDAVELFGYHDPSEYPTAGG